MHDPDRTLPRDPAPPAADAPRARPSPDGWPAPGDHVLGHEVVGELGRGGTSRVYLARDLLLDREVALKVLDAPAGDPAGVDAWYARFLAEARATARLAHPGIVTIHGAGRVGARPCLVLERLVGGTLRERLAAGPLAPAEAIALGVRVARTLAHVHRLGLTHRDLHPNNVWLGPDGEARLLDLGLAAPSGARPTVDEATPGYAPPERDRGAPEDGASDVFGLCATLCRVLLGRPPPRRAAGGVDLSLLDGDALPADLAALLRAGLADDPADRPDAERLAEGLARLGAAAATRAPPLRPMESFGRDRALADLHARLASGARLLTLLGPAGVGKTHLARAWLARLAGDRPVAFVDATEARTADELVAEVLRTFRVSGGAAPAGVVPGLLRGQGSLVLALDNLEQVVGPAAALVSRWLAEAPHLVIVATSREPLGAPDEVRVPVEPLAVPDDEATDDAIAADPSVRMFVARAREVRPELPFDAAALRRVASLVRHLDGLPLAIELTAARLGGLSLQALEAQVPGRLELAAPDRARAGGRHATLRAALDASWALLEPPERLALARWSVFRAGFWLDGARAVLGDTPVPAHRLLASLVERSLIRATLAADGELRYAMLPTIAEYAAERLADAASVSGATGPGAAREAEARHGSWFASFFTERDHVYAPDPSVRTRLEADFDDAMAAVARAVDRGDAAAAVGASLTLHAIASWSGRECLALPVIERVAALPLDPRGAAVVDQLLGRMCTVTFAAGAWAHLVRAEARCEAAGLQELAATARSAQVHALAHEGRVKEAIALGRRVVDELAALGHPVPVAVAWHRLGVALHLAGRLDEAEAAFREARAHAPAGVPGHAGPASATSLGILAKRAGRNVEAEALYREGIAGFAACGDQTNQALATMNLAILVHQSGRREEASPLYADAARLAGRIGAERLLASIRYNSSQLTRERDPAAGYRELAETVEISRHMSLVHIRAAALTRMALWLGEDGRFAEARRTGAEARAVSREAGVREQAWAALYAGRVEQLAGDDDAAGPILEEALALAQRADEESIVAEVLPCLAEHHLRRGEWALATGAAELGEALARKNGRPSIVADALRARARIARAQGREAGAVALETEADALPT